MCALGYIDGIDQGWLLTDHGISYVVSKSKSTCLWNFCHRVAELSIVLTEWICMQL